MAKKGQKQNPLAYEFKEEIIQRYAKGERNPTRLSEEYGVSKKTIQNWIYKLEHTERFPGLGMKRGRPRDSETDWKERYEILKKYRAFLKAQRERK
ncbi:MAG: helix-turn-helix domain-containing protein [Erysipelotrichaceae bacterium]|nr:helix-turn-helix domain-containing protein [Erysipelotrichaceae bacterium]